MLVRFMFLSTPNFFKLVEREVLLKQNIGKSHKILPHVKLQNFLVIKQHLKLAHQIPYAQGKHQIPMPASIMPREESVYFIGVLATSLKEKCRMDTE